MNNKIDTNVFQWMQAHHSEWGTYFFRDMTSFGGVTGSVAVLLFSTGIFLLLGNYKTALIFAGTFLLSSLLVTAIKQIVRRPRPLPYDPDTHIWDSVTSFLLPPVPHFASFPSGHTVSSVVLYTMIAVLLGNAFPALATYLLFSALGLAAIVGLSRVYLGAHWLSDVLAGYGIGLGIIYLWFKLFV